MEMPFTMDVVNVFGEIRGSLHVYLIVMEILRVAGGHILLITAEFVITTNGIIVKWIVLEFGVAQHILITVVIV